MPGECSPRGRAADIPIGEGAFEVTLKRADHVEIAKLFNRVSAETEALVADLWPAIARVAEELVNRHTLFENEIDALIADRPLAAAVLDRLVS